jgi:HD superfamily phosphohydrolase
LRKIINDPVHGFITINDELIGKIISHPYFQRLRRIKQMALAYLVYPGAVHTRFHHSLGAYHLMGCALDELKQKGISISQSEEQAAKIAILLHDIGHGPFSHALEHTVVDVHHEALSLLIMQKLNMEMKGDLTEAISVFTNQHPKKYLHQLVSSQLDVDRLDYLARDSFFTGVSEGVIGYDRIIKMLNVYNNELVVEEKGIHSIEKYLIARRLMYWQVYLHKTVLSSELMLVKILERAKLIHTIENPLFATPSLSFFLNQSYNIQSFHENEACLKHFCNLDDNDISTSIKVWASHTDKILSDLCTRLLNRNLFKVNYYSDASSLNLVEIISNMKQSMELNDDELKYYYSIDTISNTAYNEVEEEINIMFKNGQIQRISDVENTLIQATVSEHVKKQYICYSKQT